MSSVPFLSTLAQLATASDAPHAEAGRGASAAASGGAPRGAGPGVTLGPVFGVTATISAKGLQALADDAVDVVDVVEKAADAVTDTVGDVAGAVGNVVGNVVGYGVMVALGGGAVLDELV